MDVSPAEAESLQMESESSYGFIRQLAPVVRFSDTKPAWSRPSPALGEHQPQWLEPVAARV
jgi:crotonobetainyl-CoA:carnitine CoA-transferase CaiB-like acyl-CoA transferase